MTAGTKTTAGAVVIMLVSFIAYILWQKVILIKSLSFGLVGLKLDGNFINPQILITIKISNSSNKSANLENISGSIFSEDGVKVADVILQQSIIILPNAFINLQLKIDPVMNNFMDLVSPLLNDPNTKFIFSGAVVADGVSLPLKLSYSVKDLMNA